MMIKMIMRIGVASAAFLLGVTAFYVTGVSRPPAAAQASPALPAALSFPARPPALIFPEAPPLPAKYVPEWEPPKSPPHAAHVLEVGEFHGEEVRARTGERWLGLYVTKKGSALANSVLKITTVRDEIVDSGPYEKTGKRVSVGRSPDPVLLVKGAPSLRPGPISTVFVGSMALGNATNLYLSLGGTSYGLYVKTSDRSYGSAIGRDDAKLILTRGEDAEQVLYDLGGDGGPVEGYWELLWAGDMDGDGKLDIYVQVGYHYNVIQRKLFLSSQAGKGKLVREVAEFAMWGC